MAKKAEENKTPVDSLGALKALNLAPKKEGARPQIEYLGYLCKRGYLSRFKINRKSYVYWLEDCKELFYRAVNEGIILTHKPTKQ